MLEIERSEMERIEGGDWNDFWDGVACGSGIVLSIAATASPDPVSKFALYGIYAATAVACGKALT